jgi:hypothetical protein
MSKKHYWLAFYKAVIDKDYSKACDLYKITPQEKNHYPQTSYIDYDLIFKLEAPLEVLTSIIENYDNYDAWKDIILNAKSQELIDSQHNYYLNYYQAVRDKDLTKTIELSKIEDETLKSNYMVPISLDFEDIFQTQHPQTFINSILNSEEYKEFYTLYSEAYDNPQATEENITLREKNHKTLMNSPIVNHSPNPLYNSSPIKTLLSISYSSLHNSQKIENTLESVIEFPIISDIYSVMSAFTHTTENKTTSIAFVGDKISTHNPTLDDSTAGLADAHKARVTITNQELVETSVHELCHYALHAVFNNNAKPYNNEISKNKYHLAIKNTLLNIKEYLNLPIQFENQDDTYKLGKTLSSMILPAHLNKDGVQELISLFKNNHLDINGEYYWLNNESLLSTMLSSLQLDMADLLVENGASLLNIIPSEDLSVDMNLLDWLLENAPYIDINHKDQEGMTALDYAKDDQISSKLISLGAIAYPPTYNFLCPANFKDPENIDEDNPFNKSLLAINKFLNIYDLSSYGPEAEEVEFIVVLPEIMAAGLYKGPIPKIVEPLMEYFQEEVSPDMQEYAVNHSLDNISHLDLNHDYNSYDLM